jgi:predicted RNA-binding protein with PUA-like domain
MSAAKRAGSRAGGTPRHWLLKSEPESFSFDDLWRAPQRTTPWDGVRNHQARNMLRDELAPGDGVLIYHSSCEPPGVAGLAVVASEARVDPTQFDPRDEHVDPKSDPDDPRWWLVDVRAIAPLPRYVTLAELRAERALAGMALLRMGQRLSVQPVRAAEWRRVLELAGLESDPLEAEALRRTAAKARGQRASR